MADPIPHEITYCPEEWWRIFGSDPQQGMRNVGGTHPRGGPREAGLVQVVLIAVCSKLYRAR